MDSYYSSPSSSSFYYSYQSSCPLHESSSPYSSESSYIDPYSSYQPQPTSSYYYPIYQDLSTSPIPFYNHSTPSTVYAQPTPPPSTTNQSVTATTQSTSNLNSTFELVPPAGRRRRQRTIFSKDQVDLLDQVFEKNQYPDIQLREQLSQRLDVPEARIQVWFKNRRSRARTTIKSKF